MTKKLIAAIMISLLLTSSAAFAAPDNQSISLKGYTINGTSMVPLRDICEALGASVTWDDKTQTATTKKGEKVLSLSLGSVNGILNGKDLKITEAPVSIDGKTHVPLRIISEAMNSVVTWENKTRTAVIDGKIVVKVQDLQPSKAAASFTSYSGSWEYQAPAGNYVLQVDLKFKTGTNATVTLAAGYAPENNPGAARQADSSPTEIVFSKDGTGTFKYVDSAWLGEGRGTIKLKNDEIIVTLVRDNGESYFFDGTYHLKR